MKKAHTIIIIAMLLASVTAISGFATAQSGDPYVRVIWNTADELIEWENEASESQWIFGPQPTIWVGYADNLTSIGENFYQAELETELLLNITIPQAFLGEGNDLDIVRFWGSKHIDRSPIFVMEYNATSDSWAYFSFRYQPGQTEPIEGNFLVLDSTECEYETGADFYKVVFSFHFEGPLVPGIFWTGMQTIDTKGRPLSPSWLSRLTSESGFQSPPIGLGMSVSPQSFDLPTYYYAEFTNPEGDLIHYVNDNETFIMDLSAQVELGDVLIPISFLTFENQYKHNLSFSQPVNYETNTTVMFDPDAPFETITWEDSGPMLFFKHNTSGVFIESGYLNIEFYWATLIGDVGMWLPNITMIHNTTISNESFLSQYFITNSTYTDVNNGGYGVSWGGYFTNKTDMDPDPLNNGAMIEPEPGLITVEGINGEFLYPRPEMEIKNTLRLSYKFGFIEAYVYNDVGEIAESGMQGDNLNMTFIVHQDDNLVNGSTYFNNDGYDFQVNKTLSNFSVQVSGEGSGANETHYWNSGATLNFTINFDSGTIGVWGVTVKNVREHGTGTLVDVEIEIGQQWTVSDYTIDIQDTETIVSVNVTFGADVPSMVINRAKTAVGQIENIAYWNGTDWSQRNITTGELIDGIIDQFKWTDLSPYTLWSPVHFRLGDVNVFIEQAWTVTEEGAIDLDGNPGTTEDQYFIKRTGYWHEWGNTSVEGMSVITGFDPTPRENGDEFIAHSWMGAVQMVMEFEANETFYWYHTDYSPVSESELADIHNLMWINSTENIPAPEYSYIAWLSENRTLDLSAYTGLEDNVWTNTWFAWGTQQAFNVATSESQKTWASFRAEYAGLLVFNDIDPVGPEEPNEAPDFSFNDGIIETDEVTHVVLIDDVESLELRQPFGATNGTGDVIVDPETDVSFGISIYNVSVSMYPLQIENGEGIRGPWHFRQSYEGALGLNSTDFDYWITHATIDEMAFDITFSVDMVQYDPEDETTWNHAASFKIDQYFGEWNLTEFDNSVLADRGLAVNFFATLGTGTRTQYQAGTTPVTSTNDDSQSADYYQFGSENSPFANVSMGGLPYTYGGDGHSTTFYSGSSTVPVGAFSAMYESSSGGTVTNWNVDATMLFMTAGYVNWGGEDIICDPVFVSYSSSQYSGSSTTTSTSTTTTSPPSTTTTTTPPGGRINGGLYLLVGGAVFVLVIVMVLSRRKRQ